ncbi:MAG TPA: Xaa-Pro aminopeptidase [Bryobacteraceae bacterium]|nr:Xaa-Pro aminopeptidase [Bryobacteraceae bacterium]
MSSRLGRIIPAFLLFSALSSAGDGWYEARRVPASWQRDRIADLAAHRRAVMDRIGPQGVLVLFAAEARNYAGDVDWPYRQENDFYYLTELSQPGAALVLVPGGDSLREFLFLPPSNPAQEMWTGHILTADEARRISGIQQVFDLRRLGEFLRLLAPQSGEAFEPKLPPAPRGAAIGPAPPLPEEIAARFRAVRERSVHGETHIYLLDRGAAEHQREIDLASKLATLSPMLPVEDATAVFSTLRAVKSPRETDLLRHAIDITAEGFERAYALAAPGMPEYEIQAQLEFTFLRRNAHWGYPSIIGSGANATTLHYETNRDIMPAGGLLLMDAAAEFDGYSGDVTRTIPLSGKFTREQAEIYRLVWQAQQAAITVARPGHKTGPGGPESLQGAAAEIFKRGLFQLGLITDPSSDRELRIWFPHGISHSIGLNVHDPSPAELQPGMVVTVEPGLYFRLDALDNLPKTDENARFIAAIRPVFEKYKGIGVRIEDDVLITSGAPEVLSSVIPSKLEDVEQTIARLHARLRTTPLP